MSDYLLSLPLFVCVCLFVSSNTIFIHPSLLPIHRAKNTPQLEEKLQNIKTATDATRHLQNAMQCHTQLAAKRNETLLLEILTPTQAALFKEWFKKNKDMCKALMEMELAAAADSSNVQNESTLGCVCKQLDDMRL